MGSVLSFDLAAEVADLAREPGWAKHGHNARTLIKHSEFRLVLIVLESGERIDSKHSDERMCIQALDGALSLCAAGQHHRLTPGTLVALDRDLPFEIVATERCTLLLWVGWSGDPRFVSRPSTAVAVDADHVVSQDAEVA